MGDPDAFQSWYTIADGETKTGLADELFQDTLVAFKTELSKDETKLQWIEDSKLGSLTEVLASVVDARLQYEERKGGSATRRTLVELSEKIHHYGSIMDIMVQHHPEYVSLAWGAMKVLFVGVVNQQNLVSRLSTGLCEIADVLPRAELTLKLYPTHQIRHIVVALYAHVLKFLLRALRWYQESKAMHVVHAITRPAELRYDDILRKIASLSRSLSEVALASGLAEQRDMHNKMRQQLSCQTSMQMSISQLASMVLQMQESMATEQVIQASARIEIRQSLTNIQLAQFISLLSEAALLDPTKALQASVFLRNRRRLKPSSRGPPFWLDSKMQIWNRIQESNLVMINGTRKLRFHIRDFCTDSIISLRESNIPVIWALKAIDSSQETLYNKIEGQITAVEILKCLISQAIQINALIHTDAALTPRLKAYHRARTEEEWLEILVSVLQDIPQMYIIIDLELIHPQWAEQAVGFSWPAAIRKIFAELSRRNCRSVIKVALVSYGSPVLGGRMESGCPDQIVRVASARSRLGSAMPSLERGKTFKLSRRNAHLNAKQRKR
ncbi:hypothetical protein F4677DRAFT_447034 [Hypoxylon crocopeplum]|nr:hypothetical protein F4677DRAFT_447034 [Hypoxylon crocopeplum]